MVDASSLQAKDSALLLYEFKKSNRHGDSIATICRCRSHLNGWFKMEPLKPSALGTCLLVGLTICAAVENEKMTEMGIQRAEGSHDDR